MCVHICILLTLFWYMKPSVCVSSLLLFISVYFRLFCNKSSTSSLSTNDTWGLFFSFFLKGDVSVCSSWPLPLCWCCWWWLPWQLGPVQPARRMNWIMGTGTTEKEVNHEPHVWSWYEACKSLRGQTFWSWGLKREFIGELNEKQQFKKLCRDEMDIWILKWSKGMCGHNIPDSFRLFLFKWKPDGVMFWFQLTVWMWPQCAVWPEF